MELMGGGTEGEWDGGGGVRKEGGGGGRRGQEVEW